MLQTLPVSSNSEVLIMFKRWFAIDRLVNNEYTSYITFFSDTTKAGIAADPSQIQFPSQFFGKVNNHFSSSTKSSLFLNHIFLEEIQL